jgi:hypothetical protein
LTQRESEIRDSGGLKKLTHPALLSIMPPGENRHTGSTLGSDPLGEKNRLAFGTSKFRELSDYDDEVEFGEPCEFEVT